MILFDNRFNHRLDRFGHFHEAEIGRVDTVDGAFVGMFAEERAAVEEMDVLVTGGLSGSHKIGLEFCSAPGRFELGVAVQFACVTDFGHDQNGDIFVVRTKKINKGGERFSYRLSGVRLVVENDKLFMINLIDEFGEGRLAFAVSGETEIDEFLIDPSAENIGVCHAGS